MILTIPKKSQSYIRESKTRLLSKIKCIVLKWNGGLWKYAKGGGLHSDSRSRTEGGIWSQFVEQLRG